MQQTVHFGWNGRLAAHRSGRVLILPQPGFSTGHQEWGPEGQSEGRTVALPGPCCFLGDCRPDGKRLNVAPDLVEVLTLQTLDV